MASIHLCIELASRREEHWEQFDDATKAALAILQDCKDRRGLSGQIDGIDDDILAEIVDSWAEIIREVQS